MQGPEGGVARASLSTRCLRCLCCWKPSYASVVSHPLVLEGLAMAYRLGQLRLVDSTARWDLDHSLRSRQLTEVRLSPAFVSRELAPLRARVASRVWSINEDHFSCGKDGQQAGGGGWDYFQLAPCPSWQWRPPPVPDQAKLVEALLQLERLTRDALAQHDATYPRLAMVPATFPLSTKPLVDAAGKQVTDPLALAASHKTPAKTTAAAGKGKAAAGGANKGKRRGSEGSKRKPGAKEDDEEEGKEANEEGRRAGGAAEDEVDVVEQLLQRQLGGVGEGLVAWEATGNGLLTYVVYKAPPPADGQGYEKWRMQHRSTYVKLVVLGRACLSPLSSAVQGYLDALHHDEHSRDQALAAHLARIASLIQLDRVLALLPPHLRVLTLVPGACSLLDILPLHALPLQPPGGEGAGKKQQQEVTTLSDRYDVRYASSLVMLDVVQRRQKEVAESTPWFLSQLCLLEVRRPATHPLAARPRASRHASSCPNEASECLVANARAMSVPVPCLSDCRSRRC